MICVQWEPVFLVFYFIVISKYLSNPIIIMSHQHDRKTKDGKTRQKKKDDKKRIRLNTTPRQEIKQLATSEIETEVSDSASFSSQHL